MEARVAIKRPQRRIASDQGASAHGARSRTLDRICAGACLPRLPVNNYILAATLRALSFISLASVELSPHWRKNCCRSGTESFSGWLLTTRILFHNTGSVVVWRFWGGSLAVSLVALVMGSMTLRMRGGVLALATVACRGSARPVSDLAGFRRSDRLRRGLA